MFKKLGVSIKEIAGVMLERSRKEFGSDKSVIGLLIKAENAETKGIGMTKEEVSAQMNGLILAGYETTSISLTWALVELSRHPDMQVKLREELLAQFPSGTPDPTWDQLTNAESLPYLDAIIHEVLRLHPALPTTIRTAHSDDVLPLTNPIATATGETVSSIFIAKGTTVVVPIGAVNRSNLLWGEDAAVFSPERWLVQAEGAGQGDGDNAEGKKGRGKEEVSGYRHLLTFVDGPRTCLGKAFALAEFKAVLSVLIRNYTFELPGGPDTKIEIHRGVLARPKVAGQNGAKVPLRVKKVEC